VPSEDQERRLHNIIGWVRTAKETLPAISEGVIEADRVAEMSALLDRMHGSALALCDPAVVARLHRAA
jgi:hypothetical protein